ncbi:MAG: hypothetical protein FRX49_10272 [Trebouxia sp. A1-2]|nr:MAG: hypothetical protein FRX49_10272 [Trebouxia sp. A1-2]
MLQLYKLNYASCIGALLLLTGGAHSRPYDQVSRSSGTVTGGVRNFQRNQIARPDEGLLMHCNVTDEKGSNGMKCHLRPLQVQLPAQCLYFLPGSPLNILQLLQLLLQGFYTMPLLLQGDEHTSAARRALEAESLC